MGKITSYSNAYPLTGGEEMPVNKAGVDGKITPKQILHWGDGARHATLSTGGTIAPQARRIRWTGASATLALPAIGTGENQIPAGTTIEVIHAGSGPLTIQGSDSATVATVEDGEFWRLQAVAAPADWQATQFVLEGDPRLSDARTPTAHTHGPDEVDGLLTTLSQRAFTNGGNITDPETWRAELGVISEAETREGLNSKADIRGRLYSGGRTTIPASSAINGMFTNGGELIALVCPFAINSSGSNRIWDGRLTGHSISLQGTANQATGNATINFYATASTSDMSASSSAGVPIGRFSWVRVKWDGSLASSAGLEFWCGATKLTTPAASGSGTIGADTSEKVIGTNTGRTLPFNGIISRVIPLNYRLTDAEWLTFLQAGRLPTNGAGSMANAAAGISFGADRSDSQGTGGISGATGWTIATATTFSYTVETNNGVAGALRASAASLTDKLHVAPSVKALRLGARYRVRFRYYLPSASTLAQLVIKQDNNNIHFTISRANLTENAWTYIEREFVATGVTTWADTVGIGWTAGAELVIGPDFQIYDLGNLLPGLDLGEQPIISRTTNNIVALDSATGVELAPSRKPERMTLTTQAAMSADGFMLADQTIIPAGYAISAITQVSTNAAGSGTLTLKADSSGGSTIATGAITTTSAQMTVSLPLTAITTARKVHVSGLSGAGASIRLTIHLQRID